MRIVHYLNQFFAGFGGEDRADTPPQSQAGSIGPGRLLQQMLSGNAEVVGTVICGDGLFADRMEETAPAVLRLIAEFKPDVVIAGPAFNAGRYGLACGRVCADVERSLKIPAVTGMHPDAKYTIIAKCTIDDGKVSRVGYLPCLLKCEDGMVELLKNDKRGQEVFDYMDKITRGADLNARFKWEGDEVAIHASATSIND